MTCAHVRDRLMEDAIADWGPLEPHLRSCPACAASAARVREAEEDIVHHLEEFMATRTLDTTWDLAVAAVPAGGRSYTRPLIAVLVPLAAAAALTLALWPSGSGGPPPEPLDPVHQSAAVVPVALTTAQDHLAELRAIDGQIPTGLAQEDEDQLQLDVLQQRVAAMTAAEAAYLQLVDDPEWSVEAYSGLGDVYTEMGEALLASPTPTYLTPEQAENYRSAIADKAVAQLDKATTAYDRALEAGADPAIEARRESVATRIAAQRPSAQLGSALRTLRSAMARCPATREATAAAAKAERALEDGTAGRDVGLVDRVNEAAKSLRCD